MDHPLTGPRRRLDWAWEHLYALDEEIRKYLASDPYLILQETEAKSGDEVWRVEIREAIPSSTGLLVGDCLHNMRAALDNLAWNYARARKDPPPGNTAFVMTKSTAEFKSEKRKIQGVRQDARRLIADLQPYVRTPASPKQDPLWILNRLWNDDKHRVPPLFGGMALASTVRITEISGVGGMSGPQVTYGAFEDKAEVARIEIDGRNADSKVDAEAEFTLAIAFDKEGPASGDLITPLLKRLHHYVRDEVFRRFEALPPP